jgi:hypothetical protein
MLGKPVVERWIGNHQVRLLTRSAGKARGMFGEAIEVAEGIIANKADLRAAMSEWHPTFSSDPAQVWLRDNVQRLAAG